MSEHKQLQPPDLRRRGGTVPPPLAACRKVLLTLATMTIFDVTKGA